MGAVPAWHKDSMEGVGGETEPIKEEQAAAQLRRYRLLVTLVMIVLCNAIFLFGVWASGVNLDGLIRTPEVFNPVQDICLRFKWQQVEGEEQPVRLCSEWIMLSDPSGNTHTLQKETEVVKGADGRLYFNYGERVDYRLFVYGAFVAAIITLGVLLRRYLINRYRVRLGLER
ncbi:MAG: hypothetical protein C4293_18485 [Nitrospiraceae bacterium]